MEGKKEEEQVMSEVHLGCPPGFSGFYVSHFTFSLPSTDMPDERYDDRLKMETSSSQEIILDDDGDLLLTRRNNKNRRYLNYGFTIRHNITSSLGNVGLQVWRAALVLTDFVLHKSLTSSDFNDIIALELGAGTGLIGIALARAARTVFITDRGMEVLNNCAANVQLNFGLFKFHEPSIHIRELDWKESWPPNLQTCDFSSQQRMRYSWASSEIEEAERATLLLAADVIYSDELTDSFFSILERLMSQGSEKVLYLALEKRYNFSLEELDVIWRFHSTDVILIDHSIGENVSLSSVVEKHLAPSPWNNQLRPFCNVHLDDLKFFLRKNAKGAKSPFRRLNIKAPIGLQLKDSVIVEYPVIYVFLPSHCYNFEVEKGTRSFSKNEEPLDSPGSNQSPKGAFFREEEIEEGELVSDTKVVDLMDHKILEPCNNTQIPKNMTISEKEVISPSKQMSGAVAEYLKPISSSKCGANVEEGGRHSSNDANPKNFPEEEIFDFQQEVKDAYSDFIGEINPDDFLCLDGGYDEEDISEDRRMNPLGSDKEPFIEEALEEGEIPTPN